MPNIYNLDLYNIHKLNEINLTRKAYNKKYNCTNNHINSFYSTNSIRLNYPIMGTIYRQINNSNNEINNETNNISIIDDFTEITLSQDIIEHMDIEIISIQDIIEPIEIVLIPDIDPIEWINE